MKTKDIVNLFRQLATLISAGISLIKSFDILMQTHTHPLLLQLKKNLEAGHSFHDSLLKFPTHFDALTCRLIQIGEQSGTLDLILNKIVSHQESQQKFFRQIKQILFYPGIVCLTAFGCLLFMLLYIVPHFAALFSQLPHQLPKITQHVIQVSAWLDRYLHIAFILLVFLGFIGYIKIKILRKWCFYFLLHLPLLSQLYKKILLARFTQYLAICLKAAIPLTDSLLMTAKLFPSSFSTTIYRLHSAIHSGNRFHTILAYEPFFPELLIQMIKTGEESGMLELMLSKFATIYEDEITQHISFLNQMLEPLIIAILGVLIGGILIAMYLPIFQLGTAL